MKLFINTLACLSIAGSYSFAADWPTHLHDNKRSGVTTEQLAAASLSQSWVYTPNAIPQPAYKSEMKRDSYARLTFDSDRTDYDRAFNIIAADNKVFIASNSENACIALNDNNGSEAWRKSVGGAVRIAPAFANNKVYFGSEDGFAYCVNVADGSQVWKYQGAPDLTMITSDHKFLTRFPSRSGVLIEGGSAYCGFGLMTWNGNYLAKLNATTGVEENKTSRKNTYTSFEGPMLSDGTRIYIPQGRNSIASFSASDTSFAGRASDESGGTYATINPGGQVYYGPGHDRGHRKDHMKRVSSTLGSLTRIDNLDRIVTSGSNEYKIIQNSVSATGSATWVQGLEDPSTIILGGTTLYVGAKKQVMAIDVTNGSVLKILPVEGTVFSLALANGKLFASSTTGKVYCFE